MRGVLVLQRFSFPDISCDHLASDGGDPIDAKALSSEEGAVTVTVTADVLPLQTTM